MKTLLNNIIKAAAVFTIIALFPHSALAEKINLNTADAETIQYIPGVGPNKADKIIQARTQIGQFTSMDEIDSIKGFGDKTMQDVKKHSSLDSGVSELTPEMQKSKPVRKMTKAR
ncbi:MAG: helix-hairpin-helix domain-containing protein, partial [Arenicellales bacterium]